MSRFTLNRLKRLSEERKLLHENFPNVRWIDPKNKPRVEVDLVSDSGQTYRLRVYIPDDYPNSYPHLTIITQLLDRNRNQLPEKSKDFRTTGNYDGQLSVCHFNPAEWFGDFWLFQVFFKGRLWIEAYEGYMETGQALYSIYEKNRQPTSSDSTRESVTWTRRQSERLQLEREWLALSYPNRVKWSVDKKTVEINVMTKDQQPYTLRVYLSADYPNQLPILAIVSPRQLKLKNGRDIPDCCEDFHTLKKHNGYTSLCHYSPQDWKGGKFICKLFNKGELWLNAYEEYNKHDEDEPFLTYLHRQTQCSQDQP